MRSLRLTVALCVCVSLLASCGGGGGGGGGGSNPPSGRGAFTLTGNSASFNAIYGVSQPPAQSVTLTVTGSGVAAVGAAYAQGQTPPNWLSITMTGTGPYTLSVQPVPFTVGPGTYTTTFLVGTANANGDILRTQNFTVTYTLDPRLETGTATINRRHTYGAASRVEIFPLGVTAPNRQWSIASDASWVTVPAGTQTGTGTANAIIDITGLAPGTYSATLSLVNTSAAIDNANVNVNVTIDPATFDVADDGFTFGGDDGRAATAAQQLDFSLATGDGVHPFSVAVSTDSGGPWLTLDRTTGTVGASGTSVTLGIERGQLNGGTYTGEVTVSTNVYGTVFTETMPVTLNIEAHRITVSAAGVALSRVDGRDVLTRSLELFSNLDVPTQWTATSDAGWLNVTPSGAVGDALVLTATPGTLAADSAHFANVTISSPTATVENTQTVRVGLYLSDTVPVDEAITIAARSVAASPVEPLFAVTVGSDVQLRHAYTNAVVRTVTDVVAEPGQMAFSADGRTLFVHDLTSQSVTELDVATGAVLRNFPAPVNPYSQQPGAGITVIRTGGAPVLVTPNTHFYDLTTGEEINVGPWSFWGYNSFTASPDQTLLSHEQGGAFLVARTALNGGGLVLDPNYFQFPLESYSRESCFSPDGAILYTGAHDVGPYIVAGVDVVTRQVVKRLPAEWWGNALQCSWNGLIVGAQGPGAGLFDLMVYDGPSAATLAQRNSDLSPGPYTPNRRILDRGLAISGDGTRLLSAYLTTTSYFPVGIGIQTLPPSP